MSKAPSAIMLAGLVAGIIAAIAGAGWWCAAAIAAVGVGLYFLRLYRLTFVALWCALGIASYTLHQPAPIAEGVLERHGRFSGVVTEVVERENSRQVTLEAPYRIRLVVMGTETTIEPGDTLSFSTTLHAPDTSIDLPCQTSQGERLIARGIQATAVVGADSLTVTNGTLPFMARLDRLRNKLAYMIYSSGLPDDAAIFTAATLLGDDSLLDNATRAHFSTSGLAHMLALSGLHVAIIVWLLTLATAPLKLLRGGARWRHLVTIAVLWGYAMLTGMSPSVTRAVVMASLFLLAAMMQRRYSVWNAWSWAAIIILLFDPASLTTAGFQLSFTAVGAILLFTPLLDRLPRERTWLRRLLGPVAVSTAAMLGTAPLMAYHFGMLPLYFLPANLAVLWLLPVVLAGGIAIILLSALSAPMAFVVFLIKAAYAVIDHVCEFFAKLPGASMAVGAFNGWLVALWYATIVLLWLWLSGRRRSVTAPLTVLAATAAVMMSAASSDDAGNVEMFVPRDKQSTELIVRHADELMVVTTDIFADPEEIDGRYRRLYSGYLRSRGIAKITPILGDTLVGPLRRTGGLVQAGPVTVCFLDGRSAVPARSERIDYTLVCDGYRGNILDDVERLRPDTVILALDLHPKRAASYADSLDAHAIPFRRPPVMRAIR